MDQNFRKEIQLIAPIVVVSVAVMTGSILLALARLGVSDPLFPFVAAFNIGCVLIGIRPFCAEYQHQTMTLLLVQPVSRLELWDAKRRAQLVGFAAMLAPLLVALVILWIIAPDMGFGENVFTPLWRMAAGAPEDWFFLLIIPAAYFTGPLWALHMRGTIASGVLAVSAPMVGAIPLLIWAALTDREPAQWISTAAVLIYVFGCHALGRRRFLNLELAETMGGEIDLSERFARFRSPVSAWAERTPQSPGRALFIKEVALQQGPLLLCLFLMAGLTCMGLVEVISPLVTNSGQPADSLDKYAFLLGFYFFLIPFLSAGISMAEERAGNLHSWQLTLPMSRARQWGIKLLGLIFTNIVLSFVIPGILLLLFPGLRHYLFHPEGDPWRTMGLLAMVYAGLLLVGAYASSLCRNTVQGVMAGVVAVSVLVGIIIGFFVLPVMAPFRANEGHLWIALTVVAVVMTVLLLKYSYHNFSRSELQPRGQALQAVGLTAVLAVLLLVSHGIIFYVME